MRRNALQLSRRHKLALYFTTLIVFATGVIWWGLDRFAVSQDEFGGLVKLPAQPWMLKLHGAGAMLMLLMLGTLIPVHIKRGLQSRQNLTSGLIILGFFGILTVSGYGLYYIGAEELRSLTSSVHWWMGVGLPAGLAAHVWRGHWLRKHGRLRRASPPITEHH